MVFGRSVSLWPADLDRRPASTTSGTAAGHVPATSSLIHCECDPRSGTEPYGQRRRKESVEGSDLQFTEAVIDNGDLGRHVVRFESGLLACQAAGAATVYLDDDTMVLSATTAQKQAPRRHRLLPTHGGRRGADVRRGPHTRLVLPP